MPGHAKTLSAFKWTIGELVYDLRRSAIDIPSGWFWWRRLAPVLFAYNPVEIESSPSRILQAYSLAFCLTRADERTLIMGKSAETFLRLIAELGLSVNTARGLHGAALKHARNYGRIEDQIFAKLNVYLQSAARHLPCLHYLRHRYVGHRRRDTASTGLVEHSAFTTVPTHMCASRSGGSIWTYSQQSCMVYVFMAEDRFALGHWTFSPSTREGDLNSLRVIAQSRKWKHIRIFKRLGQEYESVQADSVNVFENAPDAICSIGVTKSGGNFEIMREMHKRDDVEIPLGPTIIIPINDYRSIDRITV